MKIKMLIKNAVKRDDRFLYFISPFGNIEMCRLSKGRFKNVLNKARIYFIENAIFIKEKNANN